MDALLVLYDECCNSSFKKEKTVMEFVEASKREGGRDGGGGGGGGGGKEGMVEMGKEGRGR